MKIRNGFVSNSSSSSFVCSVCGENVSGMDMGLAEAEMLECVLGHTFCESHVDKTFANYSIEEKRATLIAMKYDYADIEDWVKASDDDVESTFDDAIADMREEVSEDLCPCCTLKKVATEEVLEYLLCCRGAKLADIKKEIQDKFKNLREMRASFKK